MTEKPKTLLFYRVAAAIQTGDKACLEAYVDVPGVRELLEERPGADERKVEKAERQLGVQVAGGVMTNIWRDGEGVLTVSEGCDLARELVKEVGSDGTMVGLAGVVGKMIGKCTKDEAAVIVKFAKGELAGRFLPDRTTKKRKLLEDDTRSVKPKSSLSDLLKPYEGSPPPGEFSFGTPFDPVHPKKPSSWASLTDTTHEFLVDLKYDGERLLVHRLGEGDYHIFSRNRLPVPDKKLEGVVPILDEALKGVKTAILDAEILSKFTFGGLNPISKDVVALHPIIYPFDLVYLDGVCLATAPLSVRRKILADILVEKKGYIELPTCIDLKGTPSERKATLTKYLEERIFSRQVEGVVLKPTDSPYSLGDKNLWFKVKRGYLDGVANPNLPNLLMKEVLPNGVLLTSFPKKIGNLPETLDLAVVGYNVGVKGAVETVILGAWNPKKGVFVTCGLLENPGEAVGTPKNMIGIQRKKSRIPAFVKIHPSMTPDYILAGPDDATVLEIDGERLEEDWTFTCEFVKVVRPVLVKVRDDKSVHDIEEMKAVAEMYVKAKGEGDTVNVQCDDLNGRVPRDEQVVLHLKNGQKEDLLSVKDRGGMYVYCSAYGGHWCKKGAMQVATNLFGALPRSSYTTTQPTHQLSHILHTPITESPQTSTVCLFTQFYPPSSNHATTPTLDLDAWEVCIRKLARLIENLPKKPPAVHLARPPPSVPGYDWPTMSKVVMNYLISKDITVYVYDPTSLPL